ncbi:hypothetical protein GE253_19440 [Niveispirillum sp. SYP-B3756]|uniref:hypothetical protein n=1 Tax=Niveispirillum sp. SYP-B3756 TaxID=2662178 RepID=UPI0012928022|nr:hypothetical protein [Niveispirillum sp. SYP-B3756]MQP67504.1 hypothetical protein [Niveispirillum sp. SYP-B3756]
MRLMKLTTALALVLALTGCFDNQKKDGAAEAPTKAEAEATPPAPPQNQENPRRTAIREGLVRLQAQIASDITRTKLEEMLVEIDTQARMAVPENAITVEQMDRINSVLKAGRALNDAWANNFHCPSNGVSDEFLFRKCLPAIYDKLVEIGVEAEDLQKLKDLDEEQVKSEKGNSVVTILTRSTLLRSGVAALDKKIGEVVPILVP